MWCLQREEKVDTATVRNITAVVEHYRSLLLFIFYFVRFVFETKARAEIRVASASYVDYNNCCCCTWLWFAVHSLV